MLTPARLRLRASSLLLLLLASFGFLATQAAPAEAAMTAYQSKVLNEAARHKGKPYRWGAVGPTRFDCSGYTMYVFRKLGKRLPHNAARQYSVVRHVAKSSKRPGDLIFSRNSSGRISHVGIYAGNNKMWHSPRSGSSVKLSSIWNRNYVVGRA